jgi:uncharacterized protein
MRLLLWIVIIFALVLLVLHIKKTIIQRSGAEPANPPSTQATSEAMVQCAQCGIHIPASEAILIQSGAAFCSEEHRLKHFSK